MDKIGKYLKVWWLMSRNSFISVLYSKIAFLVFLFGKLLKFGFFLAFLLFLVKASNGFLGYTGNQAVFFFLSYSLVDIIAQFLFREVYRFRPLIVSGDFDLVLVKPINALFRVLMGGADVIDLVTIPPLIFALFFVGRMLAPTTVGVVIYILLIFNGLLIATSFYIAVLAIGVITLEVDNIVMMYRDFSSLGRFPVDIYREPLRTIITYLIPVGIMITFPAQVLMGLATTWGVMFAFAIGLIFINLSIRFWSFALTRYTSASS